MFAVFAFFFGIKDQSVNNFDNYTMKLSVNEAKLAGLWAVNCAKIQQVLILKFAFGPEKLLRLLRNRPQIWVLFSGGYISVETFRCCDNCLATMACIGFLNSC